MDSFYLTDVRSDSPIVFQVQELITTSPEIVADAFCRRCGNQLLVTDNFCSKCGTACQGLIEIVDPGASQSALGLTNTHSGMVTGNGGSMVPPVLNNRLAVVTIVALFGPLGLPALWFSPRFSKAAKTITTLIYFLLTIALPMAVIWYWLEHSLRPLVEVFGR